MRTIYWIVISLVLGGCATEEHGRLINQEEVTWIEKGITIRSQVVERFGSPRFEMPLHSSTISTTTTRAEVGGKLQTTTTTVNVDEPPKRTKATYLYTRSDSRIPFYAKAHTRQFWVIYDEKGVVQDYGVIGDVPASP
jgi:outer membrane protein assembly factor BamE (lipoprotein component of BamABCDE complex)